MQFVDMTNDIAFRKIFGNENKKIILISFLNAVLKLEGNSHIVDVEILNPYQLPIIKNLKAYLLSKLETITDKWIYFIKEAENLDVIPENVDDEGLKAAYNEANKHSWTKEDLDAYDYSEMREQDEKGKVQLAEQRGEQRGEEKKETELILEMEREGFAIAQIAKVTKKSEEEVRQIIENHKV